MVLLGGLRENGKNGGKMRTAGNDGVGQRKRGLICVRSK